MASRRLQGYPPLVVIATLLSPPAGRLRLSPAPFKWFNRNETAAAQARVRQADARERHRDSKRVKISGHTQWDGDILDALARWRYIKDGESGDKRKVGKAIYKALALFAANISFIEKK
jgi:hypothetical protein